MADLDALIEELRLRTAAAAQSWHPGAGVVSIEPLTGGASSLTFTVTFDGVPEADRVVVLKVAPPGLEPLRNRDVLRQGTVMRALKGRPGVPVPSSRTWARHLPCRPSWPWTSCRGSASSRR